jgi:hypothetical protein
VGSCPRGKEAVWLPWGGTVPAELEASCARYRLLFHWFSDLQRSARLGGAVLFLAGADLLTTGQADVELVFVRALIV